MENQKFTIKNYAVLPLGLWLKRQRLVGGQASQSRLRSRFLNLINPRIDELDIKRVSLCEKYAEKDAEGKSIFYDAEGAVTTKEKGDFKITEEQAFLAEVKEYMNEDLVIDVTPMNIGCVLGVRDIVLNTKDIFSDKEADMYDVWCLAFEAIS